MRTWRASVGLALATLLIWACGAPAAGPGPTTPDASPSSTASPSLPVCPAGAFAALEASLARVLVREQLSFLQVENTARMETEPGGLGGSFSILTDGRFDPCSRLRVDLETLHSVDNELGFEILNRDQSVRTLLGVRQTRYAEFRPTRVEGLALPLRDGSGQTVTIVGDLTIRTKSRETRFTGTASIAGDDIRAELETRVAWDDFDLRRPNGGPLISVDDASTLQIVLVARRS